MFIIFILGLPVILLFDIRVYFCNIINKVFLQLLNHFSEASSLDQKGQPWPFSQKMFRHVQIYIQHSSQSWFSVIIYNIDMGELCNRVISAELTTILNLCKDFFFLNALVVTGNVLLKVSWCFPPNCSLTNHI